MPRKVAAGWSGTGKRVDLHIGRILRRAVPAMQSRLVVLRARLEDVGHEGLRIPVVQREPAALDLNHDAVAFSERVRLLVQVHGERLDRVRRDRLRTLPALAVAPAHEASGHHQLVPLHLRPAPHAIAVDPDALRYPLAIPTPG